MSSIECIELLTEVSNLSQQMILIIDALDECSDPHNLLSGLQSRLVDCSRVRIFISSRPSLGHSIYSRLSMKNNLVISQFQSEADIQRHIDHETKSPDRRAQSVMSSEQAEKLRTMLIARAGGMYVYLHSILELQLIVIAQVSLG